jgi:phosphosulfolactate synthase (CoM biosynthesis protein A)
MIRYIFEFLKKAEIFKAFGICKRFTKIMKEHPIYVDYVKYKRGSQILIPSEVSESFLRSISSVNMYFRGNYTYLNPNYGLNFNVNGY